MSKAALSFLLTPDLDRLFTDIDVAYLAFGNAGLRAGVLERARASKVAAKKLAERMLLTSESLPYQSLTVIATAIAVLALDGKSAGRLESLAKSKVPAAALHARAALAAMGATKEEVPKAARPFLADLAGKDVKKRAMAVAQLVGLATPTALPALRTALDDANPSVRLEAARALGAYADAQSFDTLLARFNDRRNAIGEALAAYDGLVRMGDVRVLPAMVTLAGENRYVAHIHRLAEIAPLAAFASLQPVGIVAVAERALVDKTTLDAPLSAPQMSDPGCVEAAQRLLATWCTLGTVLQRKRRADIAATLTETL